MIIESQAAICLHWVIEAREFFPVPVGCKDFADRWDTIVFSYRKAPFLVWTSAMKAIWILYLEEPSDLAILRAFAIRLNHRAELYLRAPLINFVGADSSNAHRHFLSIKETCPSVLGFALFNGISKNGDSAPVGLYEYHWQRCEIENYLVSAQGLLKWARSLRRDGHPLHSRSLEFMLASINECAPALFHSLNPEDLNGHRLRVSDQVLLPIVKSFRERMGLSGGREEACILKSILAQIVQFMPSNQIDPEVKSVLDSVAAVAQEAEKLAQAAGVGSDDKFCSTKLQEGT